MAALPAGRVRVDFIDALRGLVMVVMALDHTRDYLHVGSLTYNPTDVTSTTIALFLTRWITHFCAPAFVFLAGLGAAFAGRNRSRGELARFLITRGLWLVVLELTVVSFAWSFDPSMRMFTVQVIWAIGWSMVALAALSYLPVPALIAFGLVLIAGHNALDGVPPERFGALAPLWQILHVPGPIALAGGRTLGIFYPLIPWVGVMALGFATGRLYALEPVQRRGWLAAIGVAACLAFLVIRGLNGYGDPHPWAAQPRGAFTVLSFLDCEKYPPSLSYLLMTLGPTLVLLAWLERPAGALVGAVTVFGRVPLFYYVVHLYLIHLIAVVAAVARYGAGTAEKFAHGPPPEWGFGLGVVYVAWLAIVFVLYPACRWYAARKARGTSPLWSYF